MNLDDALRELDVGPDADADVVRRAYLRLLKTRKPEVDPAGFQRLREAYECAKAAHAWRRPLRDGDDENRSAPMPVAVPPQGKPVAPPPSPPPDAVTDANAPSAIAPSPAPPPPAEETTARVVDPLPTLEEIAACLRDGRPRAAGKRMRAVFDAASRSMEVDAPPIRAAFSTILRLHEEGELAGAERLYQAVTRWLDATGAEARLVRNHLATEWAVIRELAVLPDTLSPKVRAPIAWATREGDLSRAYDALATIRVLEPKVAKEAAYLIRTRAPAIHSAVGAAFEPARIPKGSSSGTPWFFRWGAVSLLLGVIRVFTSMSHDWNRPASHASPSSDVPAREIASLLAPDAARIDLTPEMLVSKGSAKALADAATAEKKSRMAVNATSVHDALAAGDCSGARASMEMLQDAVRDEKPSPKLRARVNVLETNFSRGCGSLAPTSTETAAGDAGDPSGGSL